MGDRSGGKAIVIDIPGEPEAVAERLTEHDLTPVAILHTHGHIDHVGGAGQFSRMYGGLPAYIHPLDRDRLADPGAQLGGLARMLGDLKFEPPAEIVTIDEGEELDLAGFSLTPIHTPGHTPGHLCYKLNKVETGEGHSDLLFSGDHLFAGSVGRTDLPGGDWEVLMNSMRSKILPLPDATLVAPGH